MVKKQSQNHANNYEEQLLQVSSQSNVSFKSIHEMFNLPENELIIIAGPCAVESVTCLENIVTVLHQNNVRFLRGGAYKPRTSPYDFQGLGRAGLKILKTIGKKYGMFTVTEVVDTRQVGFISQNADILQVGARNMQNYELLKEVGKTQKPVLLKRGISATIREFVYAAEYIALQGNREIILCERGIRTFETEVRNTLDISSIPILKKETKLPVLVDLSHSLGRKDIINSVAKAVLAAGAEGLMVEVHPCPDLALSDKKQQLNPSEFKELIMELKGIR